jgi:hypothetical protein
MPSNEALCLKFGVKMTGSDPLSADDLASAKQTRMAAHREFIRRRPGMYPRRWLAHRLGVCTETLDTYNREIPISVRHCYFEKAISWSNLEDVPLSLEIEGSFLEDDTGKKYPAKREIARKLLAQRRSATLRHQDVNYYAYDEAPAWTPHAVPAQPSVAAQPVSAQPAPYPHLPQRTPQQSPPVRQPYRQPEPVLASEPPILPDSAAAQERMAQRVYRTISKLSIDDSSQRMSRANARKLVATYGVSAVEQGIRRLKWFARQGRVDKPAGFLVTAARLAWRKQQGSAALSLAPRFRGVPGTSPNSNNR